MPANHPPETRRGKVPQALFWAGMALAPVAVLVLLFGQSTGALRAAVVLAVLTIVLLAISMAMRPSVDLVRVDIEHRVLDEMERIRMRTRDETAMVARHTAKALADRIHAMNETIEGLRSQVDEAQAVGFYDPHGPQAIGPAPAGHPAGVRRTETVHVTRRTTYDDTGTVYGSRSARDHGGRPAVEGEWREDRHERWDGDDRSWSAGRPEQRALPPARGEPAVHYVHERDRYRDDRYRDDHYRDDQYRDDRDDRHRERYGDRDRGWGDRGYGHDRGYDHDRGYEHSRGYEHGRGYERDRYDDRDRGYDRGGYDRYGDRDRGYDRGGYDRGGHARYDDRGYDRERDRYDRPHVPRPRAPEW
jgi:hypothetical protein